MQEPEIQQTASLLNRVRHDLSEGGGDTTLHLHLTDLYRVIQRLMDATFATQDRGLKMLLATLEKQARECKQETEERLGVRN